MNSSSLISQAIEHINDGFFSEALVELNNALKIDVFGSVFKKKPFLWHKIRNAFHRENSFNKIYYEQTDREVRKLFKSIEFEERNMSALKRAIVETLEHRPNSSCKSDNFTAEVLITVGVDLRGEERQVFKKRITTALAGLRKAKVVKQYQTSKNDSVGLTNNYAIKLERLESSWKQQLERDMAEFAKQVEINQQDNFRKPPLPESVLDKPNQIKTLIGDSNSSMNLPDLPDIIDPEFHISQNNQDSYEEEIEHDEDSKRLLGVLSNDNSQFDDSLKNQGEGFQDQSESGDLLECLKSVFEKNRHFAMIAKFGSILYNLV